MKRGPLSDIIAGAAFFRVNINERKWIILLHKLTDIPVAATVGLAIKNLRVEEEEDIEIVTGLFYKAKEKARPKALFREAYVDRIDGGCVTINGVEFISDVLAANLKDAGRVFAYVCTCGEEVDDWSREEKDYFKSLWLDMIKQLFLNDAVAYLRKYIGDSYKLEKLSSVNPGSGNLENWPISQQRPLFGMIGDVKSEIGVTLTESFLMVPIKSVSGVMFPSENDFHNCALCLRENCKGRRAEFDRALYDKTFAKSAG